MSTRFTALTINEGDAFLLQDNGWNCLFDSGYDSKVVDLLKFKGIKKLDLAICSHNDIDHANGFIALLESGFQIDEIWLPGLWASVLQFVKDNCESRGEIEIEKEYYNGELDSLFSEESISCESFNQELSYRDGMKDSERYKSLHEKLTHELANNKDSLADSFADFLASDLQHQFNGDFKKEWLEDYLHDQLWDYCCLYKTDGETCSLADEITSLPHVHSTYKVYLKKMHLDSSFDIIPSDLNISLNRIMMIAGLARKQGCIIRWFEPTSTCSENVISHGFMALNASEIFKIKKLKGFQAYYFALTFTRENKYSLVFEYSKNNVPIIRFSADSRITCQSQYPYPENIIVTAPHHGSAANAVVYKKLQGDDIIWVRSDKRSYKRPCSEFKKLNNKYCLSCDSYNFISEISFEYDLLHKQWQYIHGEQCRCKITKE